MLSWALGIIMMNETHTAYPLTVTAGENPPSQSILLDLQNHLGALRLTPDPLHRYLHFNKTPRGLKCTFKLENGLDNKASKMKCYLTRKF